MRVSKCNLVRGTAGAVPVRLPARARTTTTTTSTTITTACLLASRTEPAIRATSRPRLYSGSFLARRPYATGASSKTTTPRQPTTTAAPPPASVVGGGGNINAGHQPAGGAFWTTTRVLLFSAFAGSLAYLYGVNDTSSFLKKSSVVVGGGGGARKPVYATKAELEKVRFLPSFERKKITPPGVE